VFKRGASKGVRKEGAPKKRPNYFGRIYRRRLTGAKKGVNLGLIQPGKEGFGLRKGIRKAGVYWHFNCHSPWGTPWFNWAEN